MVYKDFAMATGPIVAATSSHTPTLFPTVQAGDKAFKDELGKLVDMSVWETARQAVSKEQASLCAWGRGANVIL